MLFGWDNYNYKYNYNYKDDAVPMDVDSNALAHDHNYGKVSLSIELRKNVFFVHFMVITMIFAFLKKAGDDGDDGDPEDEEAKFPCDPPCPFGFKRNWQLVRHKASTKCYNNLPFVCDICNKRFRDMEMKELHIEKGRCTAPPVRIFDV